MEVTFSSSPGSPNRPNEDFIVATTTAVVLLDGVTQFADLGSGCIHGATWFVAQLGPRILHNVAVKSDMGLSDAFADAIVEVAKLHVDTCDLDHPGSPSATALILRAGPSTIDYLALSDSVLVAETRSGIRVVTDERLQKIAIQQREEMIHHPISSSIHQRLVQEMVSEQRHYRNRPEGYWVASSDPSAAYQALTGAWPRADVHSVALATDGASCFVDKFGLATWADFLRLLKEGGPQSLIGRVRDAETLDPEGIRWPRYKRSDDATVALCTFKS